MPHPGPDGHPQYERGLHPRRVSSAGRRVAWALLGAAVPAVAVTLGVAVSRGAAGGGLLTWTSSAMATDLVGGTGLPWAFHVAAVTGLAGLGALGFALLLEGVCGVD